MNNPHCEDGFENLFLTSLQQKKYISVFTKYAPRPWIATVQRVLDCSEKTKYGFYFGNWFTIKSIFDNS